MTDEPTLLPPEFKVGDEVEYNHDGSVGFKGKVVEVRVAYLYEVVHKKGSSLLAPESRWRKVDA